MTEFIFVRHGQSQANADIVIARKDSPLTLLGQEQAQKTGKNLRHEGITKIVCSPDTRARQTAEIIAREIGIDVSTIEIIDELHERRFGELENQPKQYESTWYSSVNDGFGMETKQELFDRMRRCLQKIRQISTQKLAVVGHANSGFYLQQAAVGKTSLDALDIPFQIANADFIVVRIADSSGNS